MSDKNVRIDFNIDGESHQIFVDEDVFDDLNDKEDSEATAQSLVDEWVRNNVVGILEGIVRL